MVTVNDRGVREIWMADRDYNHAGRRVKGRLNE